MQRVTVTPERGSAPPARNPHPSRSLAPLQDTLEILDKSSPYAQGGQFTKFAIRQRLPKMPLEVGADAVVTTMSETAKHGTADEVTAMAATAVSSARMLSLFC